MSLAGPARRKCLAQAHRARWDSEVRMTNSRASLGRGDRGSGRGEGHRSVRLAASHDSSVRERRDCGGLALLDRKRTARIHRPADRPPGGARLLPQRSPGHTLVAHVYRPRCGPQARRHSPGGRAGRRYSLRLRRGHGRCGSGPFLDQATHPRFERKLRQRGLRKVNSDQRKAGTLRSNSVSASSIWITTSAGRRPPPSFIERIPA
jgi:hypothetical protein